MAPTTLPWSKKLTSASVSQEKKVSRLLARLTTLSHSSDSSLNCSLFTAGGITFVHASTPLELSGRRCYSILHKPCISATQATQAHLSMSLGHYHCSTRSSPHYLLFSWESLSRIFLLLPSWRCPNSIILSAIVMVGLRSRYTSPGSLWQPRKLSSSSSSCLACSGKRYSRPTTGFTLWERWLSRHASWLLQPKCSSGSYITRLSPVPSRCSSVSAAGSFGWSSFLLHTTTMSFMMLRKVS